MKKRPKQKSKEFEVPLWLVDGFVGVLALMIYNFSLYILTLIGIKGIVSRLEDAMGYFGLNTFIDLGFGPDTTIIGLILMFAFSYILGILIGYCVRKKRRCKGKI